MRLDDLARYREPQPGPARSTLGFGTLHELLEDRLEFRLGNSDTIVHYDQSGEMCSADRVASSPARALDAVEDDTDAATVRRVTRRVRQQVAHDLPCPHGVAPDAQRPDLVVAAVDPMRPQEHGVFVQRVSHDLLQIVAAELENHAPRLQLGEIEQVVEHVQQPFPALAHPAEILEQLLLRQTIHAAFAEPGIAQDRMHRGAQFVGHVGKKARLGHVGGLGGILGRPQIAGLLAHHF